MERVDILFDNNVIGREVYDLVNKTIEMLKADYNIEEVNMEMMITHLALASERVLKNDIVEEMDASMYSAIEAEAAHNEAKEVVKKISGFASFEYPHSEQQFLELHIVNILKEDN